MLAKMETAILAPTVTHAGMVLREVEGGIRDVDKFLYSTMRVADLCNHVSLWFDRQKFTMPQTIHQSYARPRRDVLPP
jgi:hypothetical protein